MKNLTERQKAITKIVRENKISTQKELGDALLKQNFECTQATISREINMLGLKKVNGHYMLHQDLWLKKVLSDSCLSVIPAQNMVIIKTNSGTAQGIAVAIDKAELPQSLGCIAGDDTIFVATETNAAAVELSAYLKSL